MSIHSNFSETKMGHGGLMMIEPRDSFMNRKYL